MRREPPPRGAGSVVRRAVGRVALLALGAVVGVAGSALFMAGDRPELQPWHQLRPRSELRAGARELPGDLEAYRRLEERLFDEVDAELQRRVGSFPAYSRFDPSSPTHPSRFARDWNRTWERRPDGPVRGEALLLHGLSDAPYSLRAVGEILASRGLRVVGLRLPGHGTVPGGLAGASREDWRAAVRLGVAATGGRPGAEDLPFVVVGYSNGAALALDYTLGALRDDGERVPDRLVFLSPALAVDSAAALAPLPLAAARLPGLGDLAWHSIEEEFDPFKFNSFPIRAGSEIHRLTREIEEQLLRLEKEAGTMLPPLLTIQSAVDATVPPVASLTRLFGRVRESDPPSALVLFDANRSAAIEGVLSPRKDELLSLARPDETTPFRVTLVTNRGPETLRLEAVTRPAGSLDRLRRPLPLEWPWGVYSLSHVAIPFPPDDPAYGVEASPQGPPFPLGGLELKGERGLLRIPDRLLTRLRYNPFFALVEEEIVDFLELSESSRQGVQPADSAREPEGQPRADG